MAEYQRFVAYIYEYINGRKSRNAGFAKVESRNGICRIQIHIQDMMSDEGKIEIFGFVRENGALPAVLLGEGQVQNAALDRRITTPEETVGGSGYSFDRVCGIWIRSESGRNWATVFDDEPLEIEKLGKTDMVQKEIKHEEEQNSTIQEKPQLEKNLSEEKAAAETEEKAAVKMEESVKREEAGADLAEIPTGSVEVTADSGEAAAATEKNTAGREETAAGKEKIAEGSEAVTAKAEETASKTGELSEEEKNSAAEEEKTADTKQAVIKAEKMKETDGRVGASEGKTQEFAEKTEEKQEKTVSGTDSVKQEDKISKSDRNDRKNAGCVPHTDKRWNCVTARYPHFQPVSDESIEDAIRIQPSDLRTLWQKGWKQGSNSFLMHGFYQYRYLMLGKCRDGKYVLGVPGIYDEQEQYMAKMFGFSEFKPAGELQEGRRFGYWCRFLD